MQTTGWISEEQLLGKGSSTRQTADQAVRLQAEIARVKAEKADAERRAARAAAATSAANAAKETQLQMQGGLIMISKPRENITFTGKYLSCILF